MKNGLTTILIVILMLAPMGSLPGGVSEPSRSTTIDVKIGTAPTIDGVISSVEWSDAQTISVAQSSTGPWTIYYKHTMTDLYVAYSYSNGFMAEVYLDLNNDGGTAPQTDDYRLHSSMANYEKAGTGTGWPSSQTSPSGWTAASTGLVTVKEFNISYSKLGITAGEAKTVGVMFYIMTNGADNTAWPSGSQQNDPSTWGKMSSSDLWAKGIPLNHPPVLANGAVEPGSGLIDDEYGFSIDYTDEDDDTPTQSQVFIDGEPFGMTSDDDTYTDGSEFSYSTILDEGTHEFHFLFSDGENEVRFPETGELEGPVVIRPNTAPELTEIPNGTFKIDEDSGAGDNLIDLEDHFSDDRDDGSLRFEVIYQGAPSMLTASIDGHFLDVTQQREDWFGTASFKVRAIDKGIDGAVGGDDLFKDSNEFDIEVTPVNDVPVITRVGQFQISEGETVEFTGEDSAVEDEWFNFTVHVSDPDITTDWDDELLFSADTERVAVEVLEDTIQARVSFLPEESDVGTLEFTLTVRDSHSGEDTIDIIIDVLNTNDAPVIESIVIGDDTLIPEGGSIWLRGEQGAVEDEMFLFTVNAVDEDRDEADLNILTNSTLENLQVDPETGEVAFLPANENVGTVVFFMMVEDSEKATDSLKIMLEVTNSNDEPENVIVGSETGAFSFSAGTFVNLSCGFTDPDLMVDPSEEHTISWVSDIDGNIGEGPVLSRDDLSAGNHTIEVTVTDSGGLSGSTSFMLIIFSPPEAPEGPVDPDPNGTGGEREVEREGAPVILIVLIMIAVLFLAAGAVVLLLVILKKDKVPEVPPPMELTPADDPESLQDIIR
ncbi:MAG: hypothetical protein ACMUHB_01670 [Thermoplasmatota archaeon]